jgi:hypothetical protein
MSKPLAAGLLVTAIAAGASSGFFIGGVAPVRPAQRSNAHAGHFRDGPVHGMMLAPLADPDGRIPTADLKK